LTQLLITGIGAGAAPKKKSTKKAEAVEAAAE
jgi:hypothetical protein